MVVNAVLGRPRAWIILLKKEGQYLKELENFGPVVVPKDFLFVLGDNRHYSMYRRFFGFVDLTKIKGKALYIYWAKNMNRIGMEIK